MARKDPLRGFRFVVEIDDIASGAFARVKGLARELKHESYREGGVNDYEHKLVTQVTYPEQKVRVYSNFDFFGRPHHMEISDYKEDYDFDRNGNLVKVTRDGTATDTFGYDGYDRLVTNKFAVNASTTEETTFEYYPNGEVSKRAVKDALGKFRQHSQKGSDEQLELSFGAVHDSFEMLAGMLPRK